MSHGRKVIFGRNARTPLSPAGKKPGDGLYAAARQFNTNFETTFCKTRPHLQSQRSFTQPHK